VASMVQRTGEELIIRKEKTNEQRTKLGRRGGNDAAVM